MEGTAQQISEPTPEDLRHPAKQRTFVEAYLSDTSRDKYQTAAGKLGLLRALLEGQVLRPDQTWELQSMDIPIFPLTMISKRVEAGQPVEVFDLFNWAAQQARDLP